MGGWLGDAVTRGDNDDQTTSFGPDDYLADLDAENIYRLINNDMSAIEAINHYYTILACGANRAQIFLEHISFETVVDKVFWYLIDMGLEAERLAAQNRGDQETAGRITLYSKHGFRLCAAYTGCPNCQFNKCTPAQCIIGFRRNDGQGAVPIAQ